MLAFDKIHITCLKQDCHNQECFWEVSNGLMSHVDSVVYVMLQHIELKCLFTVFFEMPQA